MPGDIHGVTLGGWHRITQRLALLAGSTAQHDRPIAGQLRAPYSGQQNGRAPGIDVAHHSSNGAVIQIDQNVLEQSLTSDPANEGDARPLRSMLTVGVTWFSLS